VDALISFTAHRGNYREFPLVVRLGAQVRAERVWADRLIPSGRGQGLQTLSPEETRAFFAIMRAAQSEQRTRRLRPRTFVPMRRALQFLAAGGRPYRCTAGDALITLLTDGTLVPCRRMPIPVGNILETPLAELYQRSALFCALRDPLRVSARCRGCEHAALCRGGLRCLSHALTGDPFAADPGCWIAAGSAADQAREQRKPCKERGEHGVAGAHGGA
jgi:radical SAM protein with 4Fe4S-binding SPASM domain